MNELHLPRCSDEPVFLPLVREAPLLNLTAAESGNALKKWLTDDSANHRRDTRQTPTVIG